MNTQKSVFNKISKIEREVESKEVELSKVQKVELSLLDDLDSGIGEASRWASEISSMDSSMDKHTNEFEQALKKRLDVNGAVKMYQDRGGNVIKGLEMLMNKFEQASKELGLNANSNDLYKLAERTLRELNESIESMVDKNKRLQKLS